MSFFGDLAGFAKKLTSKLEKSIDKVLDIDPSTTQTSSSSSTSTSTTTASGNLNSHVSYNTSNLSSAPTPNTISTSRSCKLINFLQFSFNNSFFFLKFKLLL